MAKTNVSLENQANRQAVDYWQLLKQNDRFRRLWAAQLISAAGDWFNSVAVLGLVLQLTNSGFSASLVILASSLPSFFLIPFAGPVADRFDRRNLMVLMNLLGAGIALLFLLVHSSDMLWLVYVASVLLISQASFFMPASSASIPNIVTKDELFAANALSGSTWGIMVMVGSALGGIVSATFGREVAFFVNATSFLIAALLIWTLEIPSPKARHNQRLAPWKDFGEGVTYLRHYLPAVSLVSVKAGWGLAGGVIVLLSVFGNQIFKAGDGGIGALYSARGFGALVGPFVVQHVVGRNVNKLRTAIWLGFMFSSVGYLFFALSGWFGTIWLAWLCLFAAHFGGGVTWTISSVLLQMTTPDRFRGRVFAVDNGMSTLTTGISTLIYGLALQAGAIPMMLAVVGGIIFFLYGVSWGLGTSRGQLQISDVTLAAAPVYD